MGRPVVDGSTSRLARTGVRIFASVSRRLDVIAGESPHLGFLGEGMKGCRLSWIWFGGGGGDLCFGRGQWKSVAVRKQSEVWCYTCELGFLYTFSSLAIVGILERPCFQDRSAQDPQ